MIAKFRTRWLMVCVAMCATVTSVRTAHGDEREYQIKAAFLYNFAKFVDWPDEAFANDKNSFIIGVLGTDPFGTALDSLSGKVVKDKKVVVRRYQTANDAKNCQILFVGSSERDRLNEILETLKGGHVLAVADLERFAQRGGSVKFKIVDNKVRFDINTDATERAGLKISSKLLSVAEIVRDERPALSSAR